LYAVGSLVGFADGIAMAGGFWWAALLHIPTLTLFTVAGVVTIKRLRSRLWVRDAGTGFDVISHQGQRHVADHDVLSMTLDRRRNYSSGILKSVTRRLVVWLPTEEAQPERLEMVNRIRNGSADPLARLIGRLGDRLFEQARQDMAAGRSVLGERWTLDGGELRVQDKTGVSACRVEEVAAVEVVDRHVCVWRNGEDLPLARVPAQSANADLLMRLLKERLADYPSETTPPEGSLGRIIFERRPDKGTVVILAILAAGAIPGGLFLLVAVPGSLFLSMLLIGLGAACALGWVYCRRAVFRCHQLGVYRAGLTGARTLRFSDVEAVRYSALRTHNHGVYTGTMIVLDFEPAAQQKANRIRYSVTVRNADQQLETLRDQVARMIAERMARQLAAGQAVPWTTRLRFLKNGIEHQPRSLFGRKQPVVIPYSDIRAFQLDRGQFYLWTMERPKPVLRQSAGVRNFFPGFWLLHSICNGGG
jgi:hypothetical protein